MAGEPGLGRRPFAMPQNPTIVPPGAAYFAVPGSAGPQKYAFLLVPGFTLLAFSSAVEPMRIANQLSQKPLYQWTLLSEDGNPVTSSSGVPVVVNGKVGDIDRDTRLFVCAGNLVRAPAAPRIVEAVKRHHVHGGTVGGICTGAIALAHAGLLTPGQFTLHWENQPAFIEEFPELSPTRRQFELAGRVITCGGGAAATDLMLSIIGTEHGNDFAALVSEMCLRHVMVGTERSQRSSLGAVTQTRNPGLMAIVGLMLTHLEDLLSMDELAQAAGYSRRHIERLFKKSVDMTPAHFYRKLRLDHARNLLSTTDMTLQEIAVATGFEDVAHFSRAFRAQFGAPPSQIAHHRRGRGRPKT